MDPQSASRRLTVREAAAYVGCKTVKGFYNWRKRRFLPRAKVYRASDLDLAMKADQRRRERSRRTRRTNPVSMANLRRRQGDVATTTVAADCATLLREFSGLRLRVDLLAAHGPNARRLARLLRRVITDERRRTEPTAA